MATRILGPTGTFAIIPDEPGEAGPARQRIMRVGQRARDLRGNLADSEQGGQVGRAGVRKLIQNLTAFAEEQDATNQALEARIAQLEAIVMQQTGQWNAGMSLLGFGGNQAGLMRLANAWMAYVNKDDTVPNPDFEAYAVIVEQWASGRPDEAFYAMVATFLRAYAYYDGETLSSVIEADDGASSSDSSTSDDQVAALLAYFLGAGEASTIADIEAALTELGIDIPEYSS